MINMEFRVQNSCAAFASYILRVQSALHRNKKGIIFFHRKICLLSFLPYTYIRLPVVLKQVTKNMQSQF